MKRRIQTTFLDPAEIRSPYANSLGWYEPDTPLDQAELDYIGAYIAGLRTDRPDGLFTTVGEWRTTLQIRFRLDQSYV